MANTLSRFQPIARPQTAPGHCYLCRGIEGPFISTGVNVKFEGMLIICESCIKHMFEQLDLAVVKNQTEFDEHGAQRFAEGAAVGQTYVLESLRDFVGEFVPADYSPSSAGDSVEDVSSISAESGEAISNDDENPVDSISDGEGDSGESRENSDGADGSAVEGDEPSSLFGRFDLSGDSSDGNSDRGFAELGL